MQPARCTTLHCAVQVKTSHVVKVEGLLPQDKDYFTYKGSLITPGFEEGVIWAVLLQPIAASPLALGLENPMVDPFVQLNTK